MTNVLIKHKVNDFPAWKTAFENFAATRKAGGEQSFRVMQTADDPNDLILLFEWDSVDNARRFLNSNELKETMDKAGVAGLPEVQFLDEALSGAL
jgi:quinol monooxygenase YgiN